MYRVLRVLDRRERDGRRQVRVRWVSFPKKYDCWVDLEDLSDDFQASEDGNGAWSYFKVTRIVARRSQGPPGPVHG